MRVTPILNQQCTQNNSKMHTQKFTSVANYIKEPDVLNYLRVLQIQEHGYKNYDENGLITLAKTISDDAQKIFDKFNPDGKIHVKLSMRTSHVIDECGPTLRTVAEIGPPNSPSTYDISQIADFKIPLSESVETVINNFFKTST